MIFIPINNLLKKKIGLNLKKFKEKLTVINEKLTVLTCIS